MADNTTLPGTGDIIADEEIGGVKYQLVKLVSGTTGATAPITGDASYGLDVDVTRLPTLATVTSVVSIGSMGTLNTLGSVTSVTGVTSVVSIGSMGTLNTLGSVTNVVNINTLGAISSAVQIYPGGAVIGQTPTVSTGAYSAKDAVGGLLTFASAARIANGQGIVNTLTIIDDDSEAAGLELWLYDRTFTATADNAAFDPTDADNENLVGVVPISTADYYAAADNSVASVRGVGLEYACGSAGTTLYGQLKATGTPTYTATTDISVKLAVEYIS